MRHINLSGFKAIQKNVTTSGTPVKLSGYYVASTIAFNNNQTTPDTITDSANMFLKMGFKAGDILVVSGTVSNNGQYEISSVVAGTITLVKNSVLTNEIAGSAFTLDTSKGIKVEDGVLVVLKAKASNLGVITVGHTSAEALNTNTNYFSNYRLSASQYIDLQVKNLNEIWIDSTQSGEGVEVIFES